MSYRSTQGKFFVEEMFIDEDKIKRALLNLLNKLAAYLDGFQALLLKKRFTISGRSHMMLDKS